MAVASNFYIGANDEHGQNPPTAGKRTPILPYINRSFYENEFNRPAKNAFIEAALRIGFSVFDVKPEITDTSISTRVSRVNRQGLTLLVNFGYNAFGSGNSFNSASGYYVYYSDENRFASSSRTLSEDIFEKWQGNGYTTPRQVNALRGVGMLSSVNCPSTLIEAGFMTNFNEAKLMLNPLFVTEVAERAAMGVCEYLSVPYLNRDELGNYQTLRQGSRGNQVKLAQYLLNYYGYDLATDGVFGAGTLRAVQSLQQNNELTVDGIIGRNTWNALLNLNPRAYTLRQGSRRTAVMFLQRLLLSKLYPINLLDGIFGAETKNAVTDFQRENSLTPDGIVGPNTWNALFTSPGRPQLY